MNLFSWLYALHIHWHGERINRSAGSFKYRFFSELSGTVVEIGPGSGTNIEFLPQSVERYIGVEPNSYLREALSVIKTEPHIPIEAINGNAEALPLDSESADVVISTFVLCSVRNQQKVLSEVLRVLKPGKPLLFIEHVAARRGSMARLFQEALTPFSRRCCGGCSWNRQTLSEIRQAGFSSVHAPDPDTLWSVTWRPLGPVIFGKAIK